MLLASLIGTFTITACVFIQMLGMMQLSQRTKNASRSWARLTIHYKKMWLMVLTVHGIFIIHGTQIIGWGVTYWIVGALPNLPDSIYFSTVTFSTLGYGDIVLNERWRILGALEGIAGFIHIGWSTAYLISASSRYGPFTEEDHF